jgi:GAF domain-containing protein
MLRVVYAGEVCNIANAYADPRFDAEVDHRTGYHTRTILAVPLKDATGSVVAVLQAVNKQVAEEPIQEGKEESDEEDVMDATAPVAALPPRDFVAAACTPITWPCFSDVDIGALLAVADIAGGILQRLTLQAIAAREKSRSEQMVSLMRQISSASTSARLGDVVDAVIDATYRLLDAQRVSLFLVDEGRECLILASSKDAEGAQIPMDKGIVGYCAQTGMPVSIPDAYKDPRFDPSMDGATGFKTVSVLCVPIRDSIGEVVGVLQAINRQSNGASPFDGTLDKETAARRAPTKFSPLITPRGLPSYSFEEGRGQPSPAPSATAEAVPLWPFTAADVEILDGMAAHAAVALRSAFILEDMTRARKTTSALLDIVQSTAADGNGHGSTISILVQKIIDAAYALLDCERVTLYLVDSVKQELWMAVTKDADAEGARIPLGQGLAGYVAQTGFPLNIPDAYQDPRFNSSFDVATGFRTRSMLVWPITLQTGSDSSGESVIAVLQAINKRSHSIARVASSNLLKSRTRVGSLFASVAPTAIPARSSTNTNPGIKKKSGAELVSSGQSFDRFDSSDEKAMAAFCSEVAVALKRRSVEAAFMKVVADAAAEGRSVPDEFNVSLLALYTDAGTSARLHTSVLVRRVSVEKHLSWPTAIRLLTAAKGRAKKARDKTVDDMLASTEAPPPAAVGLDIVKHSAFVLPNSSNLSLQSAKSVGSPDDELLEADDPILSWSWNVFEFPITGLAPMIIDPVLTFPDQVMPTYACDPNEAVAIGESRLASSVSSMFRQFALLRRFNVDETKFAHFISSVRMKYLANPFHNFFHAVSVLHATFLLLGTTNAGDMLTYRDVFAAMVAALGHDIDHPGHNNAYEVNSMSSLAFTHNDDAVLERHHTHTLFRVLYEPKCDFLSDQSVAETKGFRQTVINAILHTDMTKHFGTVADLADRAARYQDQVAESNAGAASDDEARSARSIDSGEAEKPPKLLRSASDLSSSGRNGPKQSALSGATRTRSTKSLIEATSADASTVARMQDIFPFDRTRDEDRNELVAVIVHTADLSGQAYPRSVSNNWNSRILAEFRAQAAKERVQGLPVAPFMASLDTPLPCARLQLSFVSNIVLPLWQRVSDLLPGLEEPVSNLASARTMFEMEVAKFEKHALEAGVAGAITAPSKPREGTGSTPLMLPRHLPSCAAARSIIMGDEEDEIRALKDLRISRERSADSKE